MQEKQEIWIRSWVTKIPWRRKWQPTRASSPGKSHGQRNLVVVIESLWSYSTLCDPMDCSSPGSSIQGISQARILEWVAIPFSRRTSQPRGQTRTSCSGRQVLYHWATWEAHRGTWQATVCGVPKDSDTTKQQQQHCLGYKTSPQALSYFFKKPAFVQLQFNARSLQWSLKFYFF